MEFHPLTAIGFTGYLYGFSCFPQATDTEQIPKNMTGQPVTEYYSEVYDDYNNRSTGLDTSIRGRYYPHYAVMPVTWGQSQMWVQVYVPVMEALGTGQGTQYAKLLLDWSTLQKTEQDITTVATDAASDTGPGPLTDSSGTAGTGQTDNGTDSSTSSKTDTSTSDTSKNTSTSGSSGSSTLKIGKLKDGTYTIQGNMLKTDKKSKSMSDKAINHNVLLTVKNGSYKLTLTFQGMTVGTSKGYLSKLRYYKSDKTDANGIPSGKTKAATVNTYQKYTNEGVTYDTEMMEVPTIGDHSVVTNITVPLDGLRQTYINNVYLYVEAMKNLNGLMSGVEFDNGKFNINSTVTLYWDTLEKVSDETEPAETLDDGIYCVAGTMEKPDGSESMSNNAISHNVKLTVKDGVYYAAMNFNSLTIGKLSGFLNTLKYYDTGYTTDKQNYPQGTMRDVSVEEWQTYTDGAKVTDSFGTDYPNVVTFKIIPEALTNGGYVPLQVFVPIMESISAGNGTQNVYLKLDLSSIRKTTADDAAFQETEAKMTNPAAKDPNNNNGSDNGNNGGNANNSGSTNGTDNSSPSAGNNTANSGNSQTDISTGDNSSDNTLKKGETFTVSGIRYQVTATGKTTSVKLVKADTKKKTFTVPATVSYKNTTCKVTQIAKNSFKSCKKLTTVTLGQNITTVEKNAFKGCSKLKTVKLAKGTAKKLKTSLTKQIKKAGVKKVKVK